MFHKKLGKIVVIELMGFWQYNDNRQRKFSSCVPYIRPYSNCKWLTHVS